MTVNMDDVKNSLHYALNKCTLEEISLIKKHLFEGKMDFRSYWMTDTGCGCLIGTILNERYGYDDFHPADLIAYQAAKGFRNNDFGITPFEDYFVHLKEGHTPKNNKLAAELLSMINTYEWDRIERTTNHMLQLGAELQKNIEQVGFYQRKVEGEFNG